MRLPFLPRNVTSTVTPVLVTIVIKDGKGNVKDVRNQEFSLVQVSKVPKPSAVE